MQRIINFFNEITLYFIGKEDKVSLENRIFNLFSFFVSCTCFVAFLLNVILGLYQPAILTLVLFIIQSATLYFSRVKNNFILVKVVTGIELHILLAINYFINGGKSGPNLILLVAVLFLMVSILSRKTAFLWLTLNLLTLALLFTFEYYYPAYFSNSYPDRFTMFLDVYFSYAMVAIFLTIGILFKKTTHHNQRNKLKEEALVLEKLNKEKNKLFSIVSHDLRSPLSSVKQYLDFIKDNQLEESEKRDIESSLLKATTEAYDMLDNLLFWAKTQMDGAKANFAEVDVKESLKSTILQIKQQAAQKDISVVTNISGIKVWADKDMLQLIIRNILVNAVKFSKPGGTVFFDVIEQNKVAIFVIKDEGVGIPNESKENIFSLNVKSKSGTNKEKGTGLGLALCKEYIDLQNGNISFHSEHNEGTTFYVELPLSNPL